MTTETPKDLRSRRGRIYIGRSSLERAVSGDHEGVAEWNSIFGDMIIFSVESNWVSWSAIYCGYSAKFEPVEECLESPEYDVVTRRDVIEHGVVQFTSEFVRRK